VLWAYCSIQSPFLTKQLSQLFRCALPGHPVHILPSSSLLVVKRTASVVFNLWTAGNAENRDTGYGSSHWLISCNYGGAQQYHSSGVRSSGVRGSEASCGSRSCPSQAQDSRTPVSLHPCIPASCFLRRLPRATAVELCLLAPTIARVPRDRGVGLDWIGLGVLGWNSWMGARMGKAMEIWSDSRLVPRRWPSHTVSLSWIFCMAHGAWYDKKNIQNHGHIFIRPPAPRSD